MSTLGTGIAQSLAGLNQAQRIVAQDRAKADAVKPSDRRVRADRPDEVVVGVETAEAVRSLKDNTHEEAREDHAQHLAQDQQGQHPGTKHQVPEPVANAAPQGTPIAASAATPDVPRETKHIDIEG